MLALFAFYTYFFSPVASCIGSPAPQLLMRIRFAMTFLHSDTVDPDLILMMCWYFV